MKALFVGVGSIGKRHIKDFYFACQSNGCVPIIDVLRRKISDLGDLDAYISRQIIDLTSFDYDVAFITNPTSLHFDALLKCKDRAKFYFVEKPIFDNYRRDISVLGINDFNTYVAAPMRHTSIYKKLKEIVDSNHVFSSRVICSSYLPDWRKEIDYRNVYSARKELGGGVNLDLIHEIDYIYDLFGDPLSVQGISGLYSDLDISSNDLCALILEYKDKICEVHLDYFGRKTVRMCELYTHEGTFVADFIKERIIYPDNSIVNCHIIDNEEFINEMNYFVQFVSGKVQSINPPSLALKTLQIAMKGDRTYE